MNLQGLIKGIENLVIGKFKQPDEIKTEQHSGENNTQEKEIDVKLLSEIGEKLEKAELKEFLKNVEIKIETTTSVEKDNINKSSDINSEDYIGKAVLSPGDTLQDFLDRLTTDLSRKKTEWFIVGLFENLIPRHMIEIKGRTSWVIYNQKKIIATAKELKANTLITLHNHPSSAITGAHLTPSKSDMESAYSFYCQCKNAGLDFIDDFIISGNCYSSHLTKSLVKAGIIETDKINCLLYRYLWNGDLDKFAVLKSIVGRNKEYTEIKIPENSLRELEKNNLSAKEREVIEKTYFLPNALSKVTGIEVGEIRDIINSMEEDGFRLIKFQSGSRLID